jgi:hypothetical protein
MFVIMAVCDIVYSQPDSIKKQLPQEKVTVNKEYDENGNLISFDSTYFYSSSGDTTLRRFPDDIDFSDFFDWKGNFFFNDSALIDDPLEGFHFNNHEFEKFYKHFSELFSDSVDHDLFSYRNDSIFKFHRDSTQAFHFRNDEFMQEFEKQLNDSMFMQFSDPDFFFDRDSIWQKHQKLLEQHMQELEDIRKKYHEF